MSSNPEICAWLQAFPEFKIRRNYYRDVSDGVFVAKILHCFYGDLVHLHIYTPANSVVNKKENWIILNDRVLKRLTLGLTKQQIDEIAFINPEVIDAFLLQLKSNVEDWMKVPIKPIPKRSPRWIPTTVKKGVKKTYKTAGPSTTVQSARSNPNVEVDTESASDNVPSVANDPGSKSCDLCEEAIAFDTSPTELDGEIKKWLMTIPKLFQMAKHIDKDFADGIFIALLSSYLKPQEYNEDEGTQYGKENWVNLTANLLPALGISLESEEIQDLKDAKPLAIYKVLLKLKEISLKNKDAPNTASTNAIKQVDQNENEKLDAKIRGL